MGQIVAVLSSVAVGYRVGMKNALRWIAGGVGLVLFGISPYLWFVNPNWLWITVPLVCVWAFWLMLEYLQWAKTLGKK